MSAWRVGQLVVHKNWKARPAHVMYAGTSIVVIRFTDNGDEQTASPNNLTAVETYPPTPLERQSLGKVTVGWAWRWDDGSRSYQQFITRAEARRYFKNDGGRPIRIVRRVRP